MGVHPGRVCWAGVEISSLAVKGRSHSRKIPFVSGPPSFIIDVMPGLQEAFEVVR